MEMSGEIVQLSTEVQQSINGCRDKLVENILSNLGSSLHESVKEVGCF